jgi:hypothetical protein
MGYMHLNADGCGMEAGRREGKKVKKGKTERHTHTQRQRERL